MSVRAFYRALMICVVILPAMVRADSLTNDVGWSVSVGGDNGRVCRYG